MTAIKSFKQGKKELSHLSKDEKKLLPLLIEAVKKVDKIFELQENDKYEGAAFYPTDVKRANIEAAAKNDNKIFSPFTIVEVDSFGNITAVDYHVKYASLLKPICSLLKKAAGLSKNKSFKNYLETLANSLINGDYQKMDIAWLNVEGSNLDVVIGPYERNLDKLFFIKKAYQGHVGIIDKELTKKGKSIRDIIYTTIGSRPHRVIPPSVVDVRAEKNIVSAGFLGRLFFTQQHLPSDADTTERYGSRIIGYLSSIDYKFDNLIYPIFNKIFEKNFKARYPKELLRTGNYYYVLLRGLAQQLHRYQDSRARLKELFPIYDEANSSVSGVQHAKHLVLKGVLCQKELEAIMVCQICWIFSEWVIAREEKSRESYLKGDSLALNFLISENALKENNGISWPNFAKMFFELENLSVIFARFLESGTYIEAQEFLSKYLSYEPFKAFERSLSTIKPL